MPGQTGLAAEAKEMQSSGGSSTAPLYPFLLVRTNKGKKQKVKISVKKMETIPGTKERGKSPMPKLESRNDDNQGSIVASPKSNNLWPEETKLLKIISSQPPRTTTDLKEYHL